MRASTVLRRAGVLEVAHRLDLDPLEILHLLVEADSLPGDLRFDEADAERLQELAGAEWWWAEGEPFLADDDPGPDMVRAILEEIVARGFVGGRSTRRDNLLRGIGSDRRLVAEDAVAALISAGWLAESQRQTGSMVTLPQARLAEAQVFLEGGLVPIDLAVRLGRSA